MFLALVFCLLAVSYCARDDASLKEGVIINDASSQLMDMSEVSQSVGTAVCDYLSQPTEAELNPDATVTKTKKELIVKSLPRINDASTLERARSSILRRVGGPQAILSELEAQGFVNNGQLTVGTKPFNFFARVAAGEMVQTGMEQEQAALGDFQSRFMIVKNKQESDDNWNSTDPELVKSASMARRHRFLTMKNLDWQWLNILVFGKVLADQGGASLQEALDELEAVKTAALQYAQNVDGWSEQVGLYLNCYGHAGVNSFFLHVLDESELGPAFELHRLKNIPIDDAISVLQKEIDAVQKVTARQKEMDAVEKQVEALKLQYQKRGHSIAAT